MAKKDVKDILDKYGRKIESRINIYESSDASGGYTKEFLQFKADMMPKLSKYEKKAKNLGNIIKLKLAAKDEERIQRVLNQAHVDVNPSQVIGLALISSFLVFLFGLLISVAIFYGYAHNAVDMDGNYL